MPQAVAAVVAVVKFVLVSKSIIAVVARVALSILASSVLGSKKTAKRNTSFEGQEITRQPLPPQRAIIGETMVGGALFFEERAGAYYYVGILLANHEIEEVTGISISGIELTFDATGNVTNPEFVNYLKVSIRKGGDDQSIDPLISSGFSSIPSTFRQRGHATIVFRLWQGPDREAYEDHWGKTPFQPLMKVKGAKLYDPRTSTTAWSANSALAVGWALNHRDIFNLEYTKIDLNDAANICDQDVTLSGGGTEKRYEANGVVFFDEARGDIVEKLLSSCMGSVVPTAGVMKVTTAGLPTSGITITDDDIIGQTVFQCQPTEAERIELLRTVYAPANQEYKTQNGPIITDTGLSVIDTGSSAQSLQLPFTSSTTMAQRLGQILFRETAEAITMQSTITIEALMLTVKEGFTLDLSTITSFNGLYRLDQLELGDDFFSVDIVAKSQTANMYAWDETTDEVVPDTPISPPPTDPPGTTNPDPDEPPYIFDPNDPDFQYP